MLDEAAVKPVELRFVEGDHLVLSLFLFGALALWLTFANFVVSTNAFVPHWRDTSNLPDSVSPIVNAVGALAVRLIQGCVAVLWGAVAASLAVAALGVIWIEDLVRVDGETILVQTRYGPFFWRRRIKQSQVSRVFASSASNHKTVLFIKVAERLEALSRRGASREAVERAARQLQAALNLKTAVDPEYEAAIPSPWVLTQDASGASVLTRGGRMGRWLVGTLALLLATLTFAVAIATLLKFLDEWGNVEMLGLAFVSVLAGLASIGLSGLAARNGWCRDEWRCSTTGVFRVRRCGPRLHVLAQVQSLCITPWKQPASWGVDEFILESIVEPVEDMRGQRGARWTNVVLLRAPDVSTEALALGRWLAERSGLELRVLETPMIRDVYG